jgi:hypothetical protein
LNYFPGLKDMDPPRLLPLCRFRAGIFFDLVTQGSQADGTDTGRRTPFRDGRGEAEAITSAKALAVKIPVQTD